MTIQLKMQFAQSYPEPKSTFGRIALNQLEKYSLFNATGHGNIIFIENENGGFIVASRNKKRAVKIRIIDGDRKLIASKTTKFSISDLCDSKKRNLFIKEFVKFTKTVYQP